MTKRPTFDVQRIKALMESITEAISGKRVTIHLRPPIIKGFVGEVYRDSQGGFAMNISPDLNLETFYHVWLHETGHIAEGHINNALFREMPPKLEAVYLEKGSFLELSDEELTDYRNNPKETLAEAFRSGIDDLARRKAEELFNKTDIEARLRALESLKDCWR